ncbi:RagB/SusD family nutrient uptake outer membrane protein [Pedobacter sp. PAMC26386]|nr:RagB/SusD family nutrient uptake outer membrane protein [Pedobacter sp. PAMC26386]
MFGALICLAPLSGCKKTLDTSPDNRAQLDSPDKVSQLLTSAYPSSDYITFCESMTDNAGDRGYKTNYNNALLNDNPYRFTDFSSSDDGSVDTYWGACYNAIAAANQGLQACNNAKNPADYSAYKGEALIARAYSHFMLVSLFAKTYDPATAASDPGIPYVTDPEKTLYKTYERKTVSYVYDMIEKDLNEGIPLLNDNAYKVPAYRFTRTAAHAFASRFYLFKKQYDKVTEHAGLAFPTNIGSYLRPWNTTYTALSQDGLKAAYTNSAEKANLLLATTGSVWWIGWQNYRYGLNSTLQKQIYTTPNVTGGSWADIALGYGASGEMMGVNKWRGNFINITPAIGNYYVYIPLLSAEEVLFNKAEALVMQGNYAAAITDLNTYLSTRISGYKASTHNLTTDKVTAFYKISDVKQALINTILDFKRVEFMQEGLRWFDILRYNLLVEHTDENKKQFLLPANDLRRVLQIPQTAQTAGGLAANPR